MSGAEGRQHVRYPVRVPLYVNLPGSMFKKSVRVHTLDLSSGGLGFETSRELSLDSHSVLVLEKLGNLPGAASVEGRIAHVRRLDDGRYHVGVEFSRFIGVTFEEVEMAIRGMTDEDARRDARYPVKVPLYVNLPDAVFRKEVRVESIDFSSGGVAFETSQKLPIDSRSRLVLERIADLPASSSIEGRVAHIRRQPESTRYMVGVEFSRFVGVTREQLREAMRKWRNGRGH